ncbi:hypothetical protein [Iodidimonas sp. SYSU 1G8]|uniref:hypothetical protein n=1 Tax=Iodidimonas sp. SYSU 1G8 TaxID=3133967 RepID=UPI0031FF210E
MGNSLGACLREYLPQLGVLAIALIIVGILAILASGGIAALTGAVILKIVGVSIGSVALTRLLRCLLACL